MSELVRRMGKAILDESRNFGALAHRLGGENALELRLARAALAAIGEKFWSPIETAPKDRPVLLLFPGTPHLNDSFAGWIEGSWLEQEALWETVVGTMGDRNIPTHWADLPEAAA